MSTKNNGFAWCGKTHTSGHIEWQRKTVHFSLDYQTMKHGTTIMNITTDIYLLSYQHFYDMTLAEESMLICTVLN